MTVSAISRASMVLRRRAREAPALADREDSCSAVSRPLPVDVTAGTRPASNPIINTRPAAKVKTHPSICTDSARGRLRQLAASQRVEASDSSRPSPPPAAQISRLSVICSRINASRPPPREPRMATSFRRAAARATSRLETLRHAIRSMQPTAHSSTSICVLTPFTRSSIMGRDQTSSATGLEA